MFRALSLLLIACVWISLAGCGGVKSVKGGTAGKLHSGDAPLGDVEVTFHRVEGTSFEAIGFAVTTVSGAFELVTMGAKGPLRLSPGEYRCTMESAGSPLVIPRKYTNAETTPLKVTWTSGDTKVDLEFQPQNASR